MQDRDRTNACGETFRMTAEKSAKSLYLLAASVCIYEHLSIEIALFDKLIAKPRSTVAVRAHFSVAPRGSFVATQVNCRFENST